MSIRALEKLKRRRDRTSADLSDLYLRADEVSYEIIERALDQYLKAENEFLVYPEKIDWRSNPNGS